MRVMALALAALLPLLSACGEAGSTAQIKSANRPLATPAPPRQAYRPPVRHLPPVAAMQIAPGLEGVIGASPADLARQFGPARLDVREGDARKLQFSGVPCVLDVYLYPAAPGREPQATYVDARRPSDGRDTDRAACVAALKVR